MRTEYELGELLEYEQPTQYAVESTKYDDTYSTPVLTAGKSFILGYTNETDGIYDNLPVIIFDDFTTATQYVNFKFKVKSSAMKILKSNEALALTKYLYYLMQIIHCDHDTHKRYWIQTYSKIKVAIPDITEQQCVVDKIEELFSKLDKGVEELNKIKEQLKIYRQAVLKEAFGGKFSSNNNWKTDTINSVCQNIVDCPHTTPKWVRSGKICLRTTNFRRGYLDMSEKNFVSDETFEERISRLKPLSGDILYSREGAILGVACIIPENLEVCLGQRMMLLRTNEKMINKFLMYYLNSPKLVNYVERLKGGSASPHINVGDIKNFLIPIPSIEGQQQILQEIDSRFSICDKIEQTVYESLQKAEILRQSILKQAFEGNLV